MKLVPVLSSLLLGVFVMAEYEEPNYEVIAQTEDYEIRRYTGYLVAETVVEAGYRSSGNQAFRILFGYISGKNQRSEKMEMTIPVISGNDKRNEEIEMTIPVINTMPDDGSQASGYVYQFVMPERYTLDTLPIPDDPRVLLREVPERIVAVHRYSGRTGEERFLAKRQLLMDALKRDGIQVRGDALFARYDGPFTPWFMRRNEVMVEITM